MNQDARKLGGLLLRGDLVSLLLVSILLNHGKDLVLEQVVKNTVRSTDDDVTVLKRHLVVISRLRSVLAHVVLSSQDFPELLKLFLLAFLPKDLQISLSGQLRQLVGNVEAVLLLLGLVGNVWLSVLEPDNQEARVTNIGYVKLILVENGYKSRS